MAQHRLDFRCECGAECRVVLDAPTSASTAVGFIRHCDEGDVMPLPAKPVAFLEKRDGQWRRVPTWRIRPAA